MKTKKIRESARLKFKQFNSDYYFFEFPLVPFLLLLVSKEY